jgi:Uncharacterized protein conserved in bacteria (DUF2325)
MNNDTNAATPCVLSTTTRCCASVVSIRPTPRGSQRRRLWQMDGHAHCPIVGVCLPVETLRRIADKLMIGLAPANDYELHCYATQDCKSRTPIADAVQRELDRRYAAFLRRAAPCKTSNDLMEWWLANSEGADLPGALWAVVTHARCTSGLEHAVLAEVHMMQHQLGHDERADHARMDALQAKCEALSQEVSAARERLTAQAGTLRAEHESLQAQAVCLRGQLLAREAQMAQLQEEIEQLRSAHPDLPNRLALQCRLADQDERLQTLQRALTQAQDSALRSQMQAHVQEFAQPEPVAGACTESSAAAETIDARAVLCVGGRSAVVPVYRRLIERRGARFTHHDGGEKDNVQRLEATLSAADLVICQTGCISHDAYWRVKDHCKRTGKRCLFVDNPSAASLQRALARVSSAQEENT